MSFLTAPFLTAQWRHLAMLNYRVDPQLLQPLLPRATQLDLYDGAAYVSLVGFMFRDTRVRGLAIPCHRTFEEVNLRFYVVHETPQGELRRGVVFIRELVPRTAIALVARAVYKEPYLAVPMSHEVALDPRTGGTASYTWSHAGSEFRLEATASGAACESPEGSEAEFITEHYWGYTRRSGGRTAEYRVEHPRWQVWNAESASFSGAAGPLYGARIAEILADRPRSAFLAVGSQVAVYPGDKVP